MLRKLIAQTICRESTPANIGKEIRFNYNQMNYFSFFVEIFYIFCLPFQGSVIVKEVPCFQESLDSDDVFVFDAGLELYQVC